LHPSRHGLDWWEAKLGHYGSVARTEDFFIVRF